MYQLYSDSDPALRPDVYYLKKRVSLDVNEGVVFCARAESDVAKHLLSYMAHSVEIFSLGESILKHAHQFFDGENLKNVVDVMNFRSTYPEFTQELESLLQSIKQTSVTEKSLTCQFKSFRLVEDGKFLRAVLTHDDNHEEFIFELSRADVSAEIFADLHEMVSAEIFADLYKMVSCRKVFEKITRINELIQQEMPTFGLSARDFHLFEIQSLMLELKAFYVIPT